MEKTFTHQQILSAPAEHEESVLPGVHLVILPVKRVILGTFQGRFNAEYLQRYLDEYVFCFNRRTSRFTGQRFWRIMQQSVSSRPLTNCQLRLSCT